MEHSKFNNVKCIGAYSLDDFETRINDYLEKVVRANRCKIVDIDYQMTSKSSAIITWHSAVIMMQCPDSLFLKQKET